MPNPNTAIFPAAVITDTELPVATGSFSTVLTSDINFSTATIPVNSDAAEVPVLLRIENEIVLATAKNGTAFTSCVRGFGGTTATSHSAGVQVFGYIFAHHYNQLSAEIQAIEAALGAAMENVVLAVSPQIDIPQSIYYRAAVTQSGTASLAFSTVAGSKPTAAAVEGTNNTFGVIDFTAAAGQIVWEHFALPEDFKDNSTITVELRWISADTTGDVTWEFSATPVDAGESLDVGSWTYSDTVTDNVSGTANRLIKSEIPIDTTGGVLRGKELVFKISRGTDTATNPARLVGVQFKLTRALNQPALPE